MTGGPLFIECINLLLCTVIFVFGYLVYRRQEKVSALRVGIAFGMFGLSPFSILTGLAFPEVTFILIRICGYILVAAGLCLLLPD